MIWGLLVLGMLVCALQIIRASHLLDVALGLAGVSAFVALMLYQAGAIYAAVIELSVGAGLVTVLFVFAISIASSSSQPIETTLPIWMAPVVSLPLVALLAWLTLPLAGAPAPDTAQSFQTVFWGDRQLDVLTQIGLIFAGVFGMLGLLKAIPATETKSEETPSQSDPETQPTESVLEMTP